MTASDGNPSRSRVKLGTVALTLNAGGAQCSVTVSQSPATATQTMLLYMPGRDLLKFYKQNIDGVLKAVDANVPGDGRVLVCYQPNAHSQAEMYEAYFNAEKQAAAFALLKTYDDFAAADPACVQRMLADVEAFAPAQHYGIIVGCHGKAWVPANQGALSYSARMSKELEDLWTPAPGALTTRSFGDTGRSIDITDFAAAVKAQNYRTDYLLFDACFMANIETLYDLRECTDYVIAAPCEIMGQGFPYDRAMPWFFTDGGKGRDLTKVCEAFWNFYMNDATTQSGCISLAVMSEMEGMKEVMRRINAAPKKSYAEELQSYEGMSSHIFYDLGHWVELACGDAEAERGFQSAAGQGVSQSRTAQHTGILLGVQRPDEPRRLLFGGVVQRTVGQIRRGEQADELVPGHALNEKGDSCESPFSLFVLAGLEPFDLLAGEETPCTALEVLFSSDPHSRRGRAW